MKVNVFSKEMATIHSEKKLMIFVQHMTDGGAERVLSELIPEWKATNIRIRIVEIQSDMYNNNYNIPEDIEVIKLHSKKKSILGYLQTVQVMIKMMRANPDWTILVFNKVVIFHLALAMLFVKNRIILSERNDPFSTPGTSYLRWIRDWTFEHADGCVFQTPDAMGYFSDAVAKKSVVIPNPISPNLPKRYEGKRQKKIVAIGRLDPQKNFKMLLDAFSLVHNEFPEYKLVIYGRGKQQNELIDYSKHLNLSDFVSFPGFSDNIYEDILKSSIYVSSSNYEGISNSMLEALGMGIPSVVTDCPIGGAKMVIRDHVNGILVPVGDSIKLYEGIKEILSNEEFAISLGKEAEKIRELYPVRRIAHRWVELF